LDLVADIAKVRLRRLQRCRRFLELIPERTLLIFQIIDVSSCCLRER